MSGCASKTLFSARGSLSDTNAFGDFALAPPFKPYLMSGRRDFSLSPARISRDKTNGKGFVPLSRSNRGDAVSKKGRRKKRKWSASWIVGTTPVALGDLVEERGYIHEYTGFASMLGNVL